MSNIHYPWQGYSRSGLYQLFGRMDCWTMTNTTHTSVDTQVLTFGDVNVTRAVESVGSVGMTPDQFFPDTDDSAWTPPRSSC